VVVDNLTARCIDVVARELGRGLYARRGVRGDKAWFEAIQDSREEAVLKIKNMNNIELLDIIAEVLVVA
jgi:hypothetical protein